MQKKMKIYLSIPLALTLVTAGIFLVIVLKGLIGSYSTQEATVDQATQRWKDANGNNDVWMEFHDPINITSESNFTQANGVTGGAGTLESPWIIENWRILHSSGQESCILIANTTSFLIIRHCLLMSTNRSGIILQNVTNVRLENNVCKGNLWCGIYLNYSNNTVLTYNWCWDNGNYGIFLNQSNNNTLGYNNCTGETYGIQLSKSNYNFLYKNTATNCKESCIELIRSDFNDIASSRCSFSWTGVSLENSTENRIEENKIWNTWSGVLILKSNLNRIQGNNIEWCEVGINSDGESVNHVDHNNVSQAGILLIFYYTEEYATIGPLGYVLFFSIAGSWLLLFAKRKSLRQQPSTNADWDNGENIKEKLPGDLDRLQSEHRAIIAQLNEE
ncbi:MAG: hypothetical protein RBG13Loki_1280 [Promethearchaeota archaeon CR_4]|nr:MAG: hypothetical protein RBG13Loki_1280 [Candidatus Lokiarchaeota archaeon CR_4]